MKTEFKVMLIDDDYITNLINSSIFESMEEVSQVSCFTNPATALHYLYNRCAGGTTGLPIEPFPDLLVVDVKMVPINGFDFITELKRCAGDSYEKMCVALLTTSDNPQDRFSSLDLCIYNYLTKPLTDTKARWLLNQLATVHS
jgi:DNA-binding response OmpR family regulator